MSNLATITNNILADSGIDDINVVVTNGSYANPAWITSLAWIKITGAPTIVTSVTATSPLFSSGGATPNITIQQAGASASGFLSSTDWTTFNNKQNALTNPVTGTGASGQVAFWNGTTTQTGNNNLFWDNTNGRLGIGTATPAERLSLFGSTSTNFGLSLEPAGWNGAKHRFNVPVSGDASMLSFNWNGSVVDSALYATSAIGISNGFLSFRTASSAVSPVEQMRLTSVGRLLLGDVSSDNGARLQVSGTATFGGTIYLPSSIAGRTSQIEFGNLSSGDLLGMPNQSSTFFLSYGTNNIHFRNDNFGEILRLNNNGSVNFYSSLTATGNINSGSGTNQILLSSGNILFYNAATSNKFIQIGDDSSTINAIGFSKSGSVATTYFPSGNVGIGTSSPSGGRLQVNNGTNLNVGINTTTVDSVTTSRISSFNDAVSASVGLVINGTPLVFTTSDTERMRIFSGGNVHIGPTPGADNGARLQVSGRTQISGGSLDSSTLTDLGIVSALTTGRSGTFQSNSLASISTRGDASSIELIAGVSSGFYTGISATANNASTFAGVLRLLTAGTERMRITSSGNVWLGNDSNPLLEIANGGSTDVLSGIRWSIGGARDNYGGIYSATSSAYNNYISFYTRSSISTVEERMRITSGGNVLIGTTTDNGQKLRVNGNVEVTASNAFRASYNNSDSYHGALTWATLQLGNNGDNRIIGGRTAAGGNLKFYVNTTNDCTNYATTPNGILALTLASTGAATFSSSVTAGGTIIASLDQGSNNQFFNLTGTQSGFAQTYSLGIVGSSRDFRIFDITANQQRLTITSGGNVGIGTTSPNSRLEVFDGDASVTTSGSFSFFNSNRNFIPNSAGVSLGAYRYRGYSTGTTYQVGAGIWSFSQEAWSAGSTPAYLSFQTTPSGSTSPVERMLLNASGNLGLGVTPSAWVDYRVLQLGGGSISSYVDNNYFEVNQNAFWNGSSYRYVNNGFASRYQQVVSRHEWYSAPSGTAGNAISFTQAMTLDANGRLALGGTTVTDFNLLNIQGSSATHNVGIILNKTNATAQIYGIINQGPLDIYNYTSSTYMLRITTAGRLLLGDVSTDNGARLQVSGAGGVNIKSGNGDQLLLNNAGERFTQINFNNNSSSKANIWWDNTNTELVLLANSVGSGHLKIASTGVATFSSSVTATQFVANGASTVPNLILNGPSTTWTRYQTSGTDRWDIGNNVGGLSSNQFSFYSNGTNSNVFVIQQNGNVGIGTSSPGQLLTLSSANTLGTAINIINTSSGGYNWNIFSGGSDATLGPVGSLIFRDSTNGQSRMTITSSGNVGIGTTNPSGYRLKVQNTGALGISIETVGSDSGNPQLQMLNGATDTTIAATSNGLELTAYSAHALLLRTSNVERMRIFSGGNVHIGPTPGSDNGATLQVSGTTRLSGRVGVNTATVSGIQLVVNAENNGAVDFGLVVRNSSSANLFSVRNDGLVSTGTAGSILTGAPYGTTASAWRLGRFLTETTSANGSIRVQIGTKYYNIAAQDLGEVPS